MVKKVFLALAMVILLIGVVSAIGIDYSNEDITAHIKDTILWGLINIGEQGTMELKSHETVTEILEAGIGWKVNMYYDTNFGKAHQDALGDPSFINMKTGEEVSREWKYVYEEEEEYESPILDCADKYCIDLGTEIRTKKVWKDYNSRDIPKGQIRIGIMVNNLEGDYIDGVWEVQGKKIKKHAEWTAALNTGLENYWTFNEAAGDILDNVSTYDLTTTNVAYGYGTKDGFDTTYINGTEYMSNTGMPSITSWAGLTLAGWYKPTWGGDGGWDWIVGFGEDGGNSQLYLLSVNSGSLTWRSGDGTSTYDAVDNTWTNGDWHFICATNDIGGLKILNVDGISTAPNQTQSTWGSQNTDLNFGADKSNSEKARGEYSNWGLWSRAISQAECSQLYNGGVIPTFEDDFNDLTITLGTPANTTNSTTTNIDFTGTATDEIEVVNISFILDDVYNETNNSIINNTLTTFNKILADGTYIWNMETCDATMCLNATARSITIDTTVPALDVAAELVDIFTATLPVNSTWNITATDTNLANCYYNTTDDATINIVTCAAEFNTTWATAGNKTIQYFANDTLGFETGNATTIFVNHYLNNVTFTDPIAEGVEDNIYFNVTATNITSLTAILEYNNTNYSMEEAELNATYGNFNYTITSPILSSAAEVPLRVYFTLNGNNLTTDSVNQSVSFITPLEVAETCGAGMTPTMHFNFTDAQNLTAITNESINYNFQFGLNSAVSKTTAGTLTDIDEFYLCINATVSNNYSLGYGEIDYFKTGYSERRWYAFSSQRLTNVTANNTLYSLASGASTSFLITIQDPSLTDLVGKYTSLLRWYPEEDEYKVVEMGVTDGKGQTVKKVEIEDVDYRIGVYEKSGTLIFLAAPIRMVCIETPCTYTLTVTSETGEDYTNFLGVEGDLTYAGGIFSFIYNDPSQTTSLMELNVSRVSGDNEFLLCNDQSSGFTGVLTCDATGESGLLKAVAFRSASPFKAIDTLWIDNSTTVFQGTMGLFIAFILALVLFLIGIFSPVIALILGLLALIPALLLKVITYPIFIGIAVLAGIVIHFMKEGSTQ